MPWRLSIQGRAQPVDRVTYDALVGLYRARRQFELARFKHQVRRDGIRAGRALDAELRQADRRDKA